MACGGPGDHEFDLSNQLDRTLHEHLVAIGGGRHAFQMPTSDVASYYKIPQDPNNPLTPAKVALGKLLFHETGLGVNPRDPDGLLSYSCASCHHAPGGFQACRRQGVGEGGIGFGLTGEARVLRPDYEIDSIDVQPVRTPSALNIAYQANVLWNGQFGATGVNVGTETRWAYGTPINDNHLGFEGTETQAIAGLNVHRLRADSALVQGPRYKAMYDAAFPDVPVPQRYDRVRTGLAIAAYERTLLANQAPFQRWLAGESGAMNDREKRGAILFFSKANCYSCHTGPALNSMAFYALGMPDLIGTGIIKSLASDPAHRGRGGFTGNPEDDYKFKVPQLYNLKDSPFYGHGGNFRSIREVVEYKNKGESANGRVPKSQLADEFVYLGLTDEEIDLLVEFISEGLYDPDLERYAPTTLPSGLCFPNNDDQSRRDLGCD
ncbi:MAG: hypothetical protein OHK0039_08040 [Bacteroidia bacterium]